MQAFAIVDETTALTRLRSLVLSDRESMEKLAAITDDEILAARMIELAAAHGIAADPQALQRAVLEAMRPDPLGLWRFTPAESTETDWPPPGFLPVWAGDTGAGSVIDWAWFGPEPLTEPFFEGSIRLAMRRPFSRLFRWRMRLADFLAAATRQSSCSLPPDGLIFHMSRCGSTLVAQMLAQSAHSIVISEAAPIDAAVQSGNADFLRAMMLAFSRPRGGEERRFFVKLDSWHALALPLFEQAFPGAPWLFLYRDPVEVMVSHQREPGAQMVPQLVAPSIYGIDTPNIPGPEYTALVLSRICAAAVNALTSPHGLAINYRDLPDAFESRILPHFGVTADESERIAMRAACRHDAKAPFAPFVPDSAAKQAAASVGLRAAAGRHLSDIFNQLEALAG